MNYTPEQWEPILSYRLSLLFIYLVRSSKTLDRDHRQWHRAYKRYTVICEENTLLKTWMHFNVPICHNWFKQKRICLLMFVCWLVFKLLNEINNCMPCVILCRHVLFLTESVFFMDIVKPSSILVLSFHIPSNLQYKSHLSRQYLCWSLGCSWSISCRRCSIYIFILDLTPGFNGVGKDNCKTRRKTFKFWDLVWRILEISRQVVWWI